ncbi:MAG: antibiotic biosynthesis monooxygenase [Acidobacteria bacterium]|nr:antibiotic biosynthesis monooxygenase [Acidobacteriota bacterium]
MDSEKITVIATIEVKPGGEQDFLLAVPDVVAATRAEEACINYDLHQSTTNPCQFVFYENWTSQAGLDQHLKSTHIQTFRARIGHLLARPTEIVLWKMVTALEK